MSKYAQAAVETVQRNQNKHLPDMRLEWDETMREIFPTQETSRKKSCPKNAFLGLCEAGYVAGIPAGDYGVKPESLNKAYAVKAAVLTAKGFTDEKMLWEAVAGTEKKPNHQMDVVLGLLKANMLNI